MIQMMSLIHVTDHLIRVAKTAPFMRPQTSSRVLAS